MEIWKQFILDGGDFLEILDTKTDIGLIREKNEDATLSITHPKNKNIKLLIVADGMGWKEKGEIAANYVILYLHKWFLNKDVETLNNNEKVIELLTKYINHFISAKTICN